jgi:hypothetical protein
MAGEGGLFFIPVLAAANQAAAVVITIQLAAFG